jgi:hypothetical protein
MQTRDAYLSLFKSTADAVAFEDAALSSDPKLLPKVAVAVRDGAEPTPEYWTWLCSQVDGE